MSSPDSPLGRAIARSPRPIGAALSAVSAVIIYWQMILPFQEAARGARQITASMKFGAVAIVLFLVSISMALFGGKAVRFFRPQPEDSKILPYLAAIVIGALAFGAAVVVQNALEAKGYTFSY